MILRWLIGNLVRQHAKQHLYDAVAQVARGAAQTSETGEPVDEHGEPLPPPPPAEIVFVFALPVEANGLVDKLTDAVKMRCPGFVEHAGFLAGRRVAVIETGVGCEAAQKATEAALNLHQPAWVISTGFAGALSEDLRRGHIVMANQVVDTHGQQLEIGMRMEQSAIDAAPSLHVGTMLTVDQLIRTREEKERLGKEHRAIACDMETSAVARTCQQAKTRFMSVRIISDAIEDELPKEIERFLDQKTIASKLGAAAGAIVKRPSSLKDMWKLQEDALKATDRLARFVSSVASQLD
jgi:adenosylhomocysteine nucleosidase